MQGFVFRLVPPRPDFAFTLTPEERQTMEEHLAYLQGLMAEGKVVAFGPVLDPEGPFGIGIVTAADQVAAQALADADPAVRSPHGLRAEVTPMARLLTPDGTFPDPSAG